MISDKLHRLARKGDLQGLRQRLDSQLLEKQPDVNGYDPAGYTPLMHAVINREASIDLVRLLLEHGADVHRETRVSEDDSSRNVMSFALGGGDPLKVSLLLECGADIHYRRKEGYDALIDAVHHRDVLRDERLIGLLKLLIANKVDLNGITSYQESGCRVLSRIGRFDAVRALLEAGADASHLKWTPLMRTVTLGSLPEVEEELGRGASLEEKDWWERTAWLLAIQTGDLAKARLLLERGADMNAWGRCGKPPLFYAIETHQTPMLRWLLEIGMRIEEGDEFGSTPLMEAAENNNLEAVEELLKAGTDLDAERNGQTALSFATSREVAMCLLNAGADPQHLPFEGRRALLGFGSEPDASLLDDVSPVEFREGQSRRFGLSNPEEMQCPFWEAMIRAGVSAYEAAERFKGQADRRQSPVWCARRFGQSLAFLPDGRIIQIGGEHEDHYDPDFCIYNDVFVHEPDGTIRLFGYPEAVFPPTDFHTATLLGQCLYIIGSLGYPGTRQYGKTPVYRLDVQSFQIEELKAGGTEPGWIYGHRATAASAQEIRMVGGAVVTWTGEEEAHVANERIFIFDVEQLRWTIEAQAGA